MEASNRDQSMKICIQGQFHLQNTTRNLLQKKNEYFAAYCSILAAYRVSLLHIINLLLYQSKTRNFLVNSNELSYSLKKFTIFYICCSCSCSLQHTYHFCCILEISLIIDPIVFKFNLGVGIRLFNIFGVVLEQRCSILQHTAAYCCILAKIAAYHLTLLKLHLNEWYVLDDNNLAYCLSRYWIFRIWCSCSCSLQHTSHFRCILEKSLVINPIVFK